MTELTLSPSALATDYFLLKEQFTDAQRDALRRTRAFVEEEVLPVIGGYWERAELPRDLWRRIGELGLTDLELDPLSEGLIHMELNRGDGSLGTFLGVQAGLAMQSIAALGSDEQRERWLPAMKRVEKIGAFALTEPEHGSDSVALDTTARRDGDGYVLDGRKRWIGNGSIADVVVVWARAEDGDVKGFLVEPALAPGYEATVIDGKGGARAIWQADIVLDGVRVPAANQMPGARTFKDTVRVLAGTRTTCAWAALGHAVAGYDAALTYTRQREQFGRPLCSFQIVQQRLVNIGNTRLRVALRAGSADRVPLLLMNGIGCSIEVADPFVDALDPSIPVVRFDAPGVGGSPIPATPYRLCRIASLVAAVLDRLGLHRVDVLGVSWGGALAQQFAFQHRSRCRRLVLVSTTAGVGLFTRPWVLREMASPRRLIDPAHARAVAPRLYGGRAREDPLLADAVHGSGERRGYTYQQLALLGWTSAAFARWHLGLITNSATLTPPVEKFLGRA